MQDPLGGEPRFVWQVDAEMIDLDRWARSFVALLLEEKKDGRSALVRYGYWPIMALVLITVALTSSPTVSVVTAALLILAFGAAKLWNKGAATRLAKRLHNVPAASEAFTLTAGPEGTHSESRSSSETLSWSRYRSARTFEDLVVLTYDSSTKRFLPIGGLASGQDASEAVDRITSWIEHARDDG